MPDTVALLRRLHAAGAPLFFLSNMPAPYADHLEAHHDFLRLFDDGMFSARVHAHQARAGDLRAGRARFGPTGRLLFIDDHAANVEAAQALGWQALHFEAAAQVEASLQQLGLLEAA